MRLFHRHEKPLDEGLAQAATRVIGAKIPPVNPPQNFSRENVRATDKPPQSNLATQSDEDTINLKEPDTIISDDEVAAIESAPADEAPGGATASEGNIGRDEQPVEWNGGSQ